MVKIASDIFIVLKNWEKFFFWRVMIIVVLQLLLEMLKG